VGLEHQEAMKKAACAAKPVCFQLHGSGNGLRCGQPAAIFPQDLSANR
jgi:hypothetical protein